jgi:hypothetical protein
VLCHHTASSSNGQAAIPLLVNGRSDLPGPLCQLSLDRQGVVYVVAAGRANHAGVAKPSGTVAGGDGNVLYIGIEAQNEGTGEPWPKAQYDAYVTLCAALCVEITGNSVNTVRAHKETSVTGKIDPAGPTPYESTFDMDKFRARVARSIVGMKSVVQPKGSKRRQFTLRRRAKGLTRPQPLVVRVANCASVSTRPEKARDTFLRALTTPACSGSPTSCCARRWPTSTPRQSHAWHAAFASGHAAPGRAPRARAAFLAVFRRIHARVRGGDLNVAERVAARLLLQRVFSVGVLHLAVSRFIPAEGPHPVDHGSDHKGVDVLLWP